MKVRSGRGKHKGASFRVEKSGVVSITPLKYGVSFSDLKAFKVAVQKELDELGLERFST